MTDLAADAKRRFDDVYRSLLVIGPVLSFAFSNYGSTDVFKTFVYGFGYPALMTSIIVWGVAHIIGGRWEYHIKFVGYVLIWFTFLVLASIVYIRGDVLGSFFYWAAVGLTTVITAFTAWTLVRADIVVRGYGAAMVGLSILLAVAVPFVLA